MIGMPGGDAGLWARVEAFMQQRLEGVVRDTRQALANMVTHHRQKAGTGWHRYGRYGPVNTGTIARDVEVTLNFPVSIPAKHAQSGANFHCQVFFEDSGPGFSAQMGWRLGPVTFVSGDITNVQIIVRNGGGPNNAQADVYLVIDT